MDKALEDVKVLDLTHVQAGPSCTQMLGFLGADVIKIEDTSGGDSTRADIAHREDSDSFYFLIFNNKRGITLNLKKDRGKELFKGLLKWADVLVENYSLGMLDRLGLGWDVLQEINPGLVYAPIKGFGTYGPYAEFKGWEMVAQAVGGAMATTGYPDRPPVYLSSGVGDSGSGIHAAVGILAALRKRDRTGTGQMVEVAMQDGVVNLMRMQITHALGRKDLKRLKIKKLEKQEEIHHEPRNPKSINDLPAELERRRRGLSQKRLCRRRGIHGPARSNSYRH